jgi:hypothetical protein
MKKTRDGDELEHIVPGWFAWLDRNVALSGLLVMEIFVSWLFLMGNGWVSDITKPWEWTTIQWIGAGVFLAAACGFAGVVVTGSYASARAFATGHIKKGLFITVGMLLFTGTEIYAGISERSNFADPSPADRFVGGILGLSGAITLGIILVGVMTPVAVFYRGWTQVKAQEEDADTRAERHRREEEEATHKARMRAVQAGGFGAAFRAAKQAANGDALPGETDAQHAPDASPNAIGIAASPSQVLRAKKATAAAVNGVPSGVWIWSHLQQYARAKWGVELTDDAAKEHVKSVPSAARLAGVTGQPYGASKRDVQRWADGRFAGRAASQTAQEDVG